MKHPLPSVAILFLAAVSGTAQPLSGAPQTSAGKPLFTFRNTLWMNLHHFLYVLGRARNDTRDSHRAAVAHAPEDTEGFASLSSQERDAWERAVAWYQKNVSPMDAVFDDKLIEMTNALAAAGDASRLTAVHIPEDMRTVLEAAAPVYRKVWWERHSRSSRARIDELQVLLARYGQPISDIITKAYQQSWPPEGLTVQMCAYANWAGAYSTSGRLIVMASTAEDMAGSEGLETIFHEAMHQWDDAMIPRLNEAAARLHASVPRDLFHSLIFYTAGYATARVVPGHHPYADALWARGLPGHAQLDQYWLPYLRGEGTLAAALDRLAGAFAK
ncbi:MAG: hypothetical protein ACLP59_34220 [Bryobacteraceae bacterium]